MDTEEQILAGFLDDLENSRLILPTLPEVALQVRDAVESDKASAGEIAKIISMDAALSARLLQVCNIPLYRTRRTGEDLQTAVARLGNIQVRHLVSSLFTLLQLIGKYGRRNQHQADENNLMYKKVF